MFVTLLGVYIVILRSMSSAIMESFTFIIFLKFEKIPMLRFRSPDTWPTKNTYVTYLHWTHGRVTQSMLYMIIIMYAIVHTTDLDQISGSEQCHLVLTIKNMFLYE